jgi:ABC-type oligopeptide transport system substrate-binding subunit
MNASQVAQSIRRALKGTSHTSLGAYVRSVESKSPTSVVFALQKIPENFLLNLSFVDTAIVHPKAYEGTFSWSAPSSGAFRVVSFTGTVIELQANPFYWDNNPKRVQRAILQKAASHPDDLKTLLNEEWDAGSLMPGVIADSGQVDALRKKYNVFSGSADFLFCLTFSRKAAREGRLPISLRRSLYWRIYDSFWADDMSNSLRASGLRSTDKRGALSRVEFDAELARLRQEPAPGSARKFVVIINDRFRSMPGVSKALGAMRRAGIEYEERVVSAEEKDRVEATGEYDMAISYLGASEADPDSAWRIYNEKRFAEPAADIGELDRAQLESDRSKRDALYKELERRSIQKALFIPLKNEPSYFVVGKRLEIDPVLAADWDLQLFQLRMR